MATQREGGGDCHEAAEDGEDVEAPINSKPADGGNGSQ
jgi:hypothetical protein